MRGRPQALDPFHGAGRTIPAGAGPTSPTRSRPAPLADHPRRCGADPRRSGHSRGGSGPSPQVRGRPGHILGRSLRGRTIPAGAGPTPGTAGGQVPEEDYPRRCGADDACVLKTTLDAGPSPQVRGRHVPRFEVDHPHRTIPAGAGPTPPWRVWICRMADHPCRCGADGRAGSGAGVPGGPSPQVRGRLPDRAQHLDDSRTIPAGAGPTPRARCAAGRPADHPRRCGADPAVRHQVLRCRGPSPQVRGRREDPLAAGDRPRTIPAGAGPTLCSGSAGWRSTDHPRRCGADGGVDQRPVDADGPSPQVRGRRPHRTFGPGRGRTIPAGAGPTSMIRADRHAKKDHPRRCGADVAEFAVGADGDGPSPQVRGRPILRPAAHRRSRTIPAGAGPTRSAGSVGQPQPDHPRRCGADKDAQKAARDLNGPSPQVRGRRARRRSTRAGRTDHPRRCGAD